MVRCFLFQVPQRLKNNFDSNFLIKPAHTTVWCQNSRIRNLPHALDRRSAVELALALMCDIRVYALRLGTGMFGRSRQIRSEEQPKTLSK